MIRTQSLVKLYGEVRALDGLDLHVPAGVVYGFLGPNGAGKTTTMRILSGLARADRGQAYIQEQLISLYNPDQLKSVGVLPEEPSFYHWMTSREYLRDFIGPMYGLNGNAAYQRADELLDIVGISYAADRRIGGYSRGMRQRLGIAQALIHRPEILLLDEPVSALDPAGRREILELIDSLRGGTTILFSTHILTDVERVCDVIGIIDKGHMVVEEKRDRLLARYAQPVIEVEMVDKVKEWMDLAYQVQGIEKIVQRDNTLRIMVKDVRVTSAALFKSLADNEIRVRRFEIVKPSLEDVFLRLTGKNNWNRVTAEPER